MTTRALIKSFMAPDRMEYPIKSGDGNAWFKLSLGNVLTMLGMVVGFLLTSQAIKDQVMAIQSDVIELKTTTKAIEKGQTAEDITQQGVAAKLSEHDKTLDYINKRFEQNDTRLSALESQISTLNTNLQLVNQQLQYIGTAHLVAPSTKK
jgi:hypothetical protein